MSQELSASEYWDFVNEIDALKATINRLHKEKAHLEKRLDEQTAELVSLRCDQPKTESLLDDAVTVKPTKEKILRGSQIRRKLLGK